MVPPSQSCLGKEFAVLRVQPAINKAEREATIKSSFTNIDSQIRAHPVTLLTNWPAVDAMLGIRHRLISD